MAWKSDKSGTLLKSNSASFHHWPLVAPPSRNNSIGKPSAVMKWCSEEHFSEVRGLRRRRRDVVWGLLLVMPHWGSINIKKERRETWVRRGTYATVVKCAQVCVSENRLKYLSGKFRQHERGSVNVSVVIFKNHRFNIFFWEDLYWLLEICFLKRKKNQKQFVDCRLEMWV